MSAIDFLSSDVSKAATPKRTMSLKTGENYHLHMYLSVFCSSLRALGEDEWKYIYAHRRMALLPVSRCVLASF